LSTAWIERRIVALAMALMMPLACAQNCTTQSKMSAEDYAALSDMALGLATAVKAGDTARVEALSSADVAGNFAPTGFLVRSTADKIGGETLRMTQVYELDANKRMANDPSVAEFSCLLAGTTAETDFAIPALPAGFYGFAMVEASGGARPWLLSFVMRRDAGVWKLAGFSAHARTAAGHDGVWYWAKARERVAAKENWAAWALFSEAYTLLRPAGFVTSTNLDKLLAEQKAAAPAELAEGIGAGNPMVLKGVGGTEYRFTGIGAEDSDDGQRLNLVLHLGIDGLNDAAVTVFNTAAAKALLDAHKELRAGFDAVLVITEQPAEPRPFVTELKMREIP
jgi:hypothetical protein